MSIVGSWSDAVRTRIGRTMIVFSMLFSFGGTTASIIGGSPMATIGEATFFATSAVSLGILVWVVLPVQPRNGAVWTLAWSSFGLSLVAVNVATRGVVDAVPTDFDEFLLLSSADLPLWAAILVWPGRWVWVPATFALLTFAILLFPDGKLPSPRWKPLGWFSAAAMVIMALPVAILWFPTSGWTYESPGADAVEFVGGIGFLSNGLAGLLCWVALFVRYRRSTTEVRTKIRLVVVGTLILGTSFASAQIVDLLVSGDIYGPNSDVDNTILTPLMQISGLFIFLVAWAVAITSFRLYDIDVIVSKGAVYLSLALFIGFVYTTLVVSIGALLDGRSDLVSSITATVIVATAFQPVRRLLERAANRLIYGDRATPYEVLSLFSRRAVTSNREELMARIPALVVDSTGASQATLWIHTDHGFQPAGSWPEAIDAPALPGDTFTVVGADRSIPIVHDGELLGGLSLVIDRGDAITPAEDELLSDLTSGLGLVMRNGRLTADLKLRVAELEASRQRVLLAADDARRGLEHDLNHGPQQQLVSLVAGLDSACRLAGDAGSDDVASLLDTVQSDTLTAIDTVRDFARGVYPPLLEAEGLTAALVERTAKTGSTTTVESRGIGRYPREVESAVYFAVLEALQNATKHAGAGSTVVSLSDVGGRLDFAVTDNGHGFDPATVVGGAGLNGLSDRLDTVGGEVRVNSTIGQGTTVSGFVPA